MLTISKYRQSPLESTGFWEIFGWESPLESTGVQWSPYGFRGGQTRPRFTGVCNDRFMIIFRSMTALFQRFSLYHAMFLFVLVQNGVHSHYDPFSLSFYSIYLKEKLWFSSVHLPWPAMYHNDRFAIISRSMTLLWLFPYFWVLFGVLVYIFHLYKQSWNFIPLSDRFLSQPLVSFPSSSLLAISLSSSWKNPGFAQLNKTSISRSKSKSCLKLVLKIPLKIFAFNFMKNGRHDGLRSKSSFPSGLTRIRHYPRSR